VKKYNVAVVGVGAVGVEMLRVLHNRKFPCGTLKVMARRPRTIVVDGRSYDVVETTAQAFDGIDIALFAGTEGEKGAAVTFGKEAVSRGAVVIDNGADYRMDPRVPLVIPEVNGDALKNHQGIIANPNCTTAVLLMPLGPLHRAFRVKRVVVSTYQAVSGAGGKAMDDLRSQAASFLKGEKVIDFGSFPDQIAFNVLANNWKIDDQGVSNEELKVVKETHKILGDDRIAVSVTTVRVPTLVGHGESVYIETEKDVTPQAAMEVLRRAPGVCVVEADPQDGIAHCPTPLMSAGKEATFVGRVRADLFSSKALLFWVVGDNLWKGAALNAVQIAEMLIEKDWLKSTK